ncbi:MAG: PLP-dependent aminotransferase family protein [Gemmatimonadetes bacterium]|uniref:PLP-dependent aminotransferase family protein n=1 Tax=Candidatus Kutchimonas denitrificans TaxID=3056748 RepID=A0AAE5CDI3_9BACT|nr:PLP-dependent aminotransferase family protein [Gemmatimonadota bacterium]NIR75839.1 PLP-dependent aminotransferase family protein [Candidatus Kutchimonas denitrificans]NIS02006.1 PLP-dependent aminotransferase family protein [Gemmatimonadota bacterium]NIT67810.1 PLP-dependent aminotransferase family protein [Gemmatimonadota bacterium]NIU53797.1 aminotransferase class I/II-fold pyridoxal phosphate-dependent enzyme [Gemmatimonadota bacterium]
MTNWTPNIERKGAPLYLALARSIAEAIDRGELSPGQQLPTQRELAERLEIALTTVTRGYREAERRGLVRGEVGRGTYVSGSAAVDGGGEGDEGGPVNLRPNTLLPLPMMTELQEALAAVVREPNPALFDYGPHGGRWRHREAGAEWLGRVGLRAAADRVVVTSGAQHAMAVALAAEVEPGDAVLVEEVTYSGMKCLAGLLGVRLEPLPLDGEGILPDALRAACQAHRPAALYCMPTLQNPTAAVMSEARRREVAEIVNDGGLALVEDDSYGFLLPELPRLSALCERAYYIAGTSKSLLPTLRIGYLRCPVEAVDRVEAKIAATTYLASPHAAEVMARWIADGTAERVMKWKGEEARARQEIAARALTNWEYRVHPVSPHGWLSVPEPWSAREFARQAADRGALVTPADVFAAERDRVPHAVRVCIGPPRSRAALERGLTALDRTLGSGAESLEVVI